jgi:hypothetical protein
MLNLTKNPVAVRLTIHSDRMMKSLNTIEATKPRMTGMLRGWRAADSFEMFLLFYRSSRARDVNPSWSLD